MFFKEPALGCYIEARFGIKFVSLLEAAIKKLGRKKVGFCTMLRRKS